jgi:HEAT repeat protein
MCAVGCLIHGGFEMRRCEIRVACAVVLLSLAAFWCALPGVHAATSAEIEEFIGKIESGDAEVRHEAFENAAKMGPEAIEPLGKPLASMDRAVSTAARIALEKIVGPVTRPGAEAERRAASEVLLKLVEPTHPVAVRNYALELLGVAGGDEAVPTLALLLADAEVGEMARWALERIPGDAAGKALTDAIEKTRMVCLRAALIKTVGVKKYAGAVPVLIKQAKDGNVAVRMEAVDALGRIGDAAAESAVLAAVDSDIARERNRAFDAYLRLAGVQVEQPDVALKMYRKALQLAAAESERCAVVAGIGESGASGSIDELIVFLTDPSPAVRETAVQGLIGMPARDTTQTLARKLRGAKPPVKSALLRVLAVRGGPESEAAIREALDDRSAEVRVTALELTGQIGDLSAEPTLLEAARTGSDIVKPTALAAYIQLADARLKGGEKEKALDMYHRALDLAERNDERQLALQGVATIGDPSSLRRVKSVLETGGATHAAIVAYLSIADTFAASGRREQAIEIYSNVFERSSRRQLVTHAAGGLRKLGVKVEIAERNGFITDWFIVGPFPNRNKVAWETAYFPEKEIKLDGEYEVGERKVQWEQHHTDDPQGVVDFVPLFDPHDNVASYAYATLESDRARQVVLMIGSDDGVVCWLNGKRVHGNNASRRVTVDEDKVQAELDAGTNRILVKILQGGSDWGFCLRIAARRNRPLAVEQTGPGAFRLKR